MLERPWVRDRRRYDGISATTVHATVPRVIWYTKPWKVMSQLEVWVGRESIRTYPNEHEGNGCDQGGGSPWKRSTSDDHEGASASKLAPDNQRTTANNRKKGPRQNISDEHAAVVEHAEQEGLLGAIASELVVV